MAKIQGVALYESHQIPTRAFSIMESERHHLIVWKAPPARLALVIGRR